MGARPSPTPTTDREAEIAAIRAALARSAADVAAGRTVPGEQVLAELDAMIAAARPHGAADR